MYGMSSIKSVEQALNRLSISKSSLENLDRTRDRIVSAPNVVPTSAPKIHLEADSNDEVTPSNIDAYADRVIEAMRIFFCDLPVKCDMQKELRKENRILREEYYGTFTKTGRLLFGMLTRGKIDATALDFEESSRQSEEDLLENILHGEGENYKGFALSKAKILEMLYTGRSDNLSFRGASHKACSLVPMDHEYIRNLHYRLVNKVANSGGKIFYKAVSKSQVRAHQLFHETFWSFAASTFRKGYEGQRFLKIRQQVGLPDFTFQGANSKGCFQSNKWFKISPNSSVNAWRFEPGSNPDLYPFLLQIYTLTYQETLSDSVLFIPELKALYEHRAKQTKEDVAAQWQKAKVAYYHKRMDLLLKGNFVVRFQPMLNNNHGLYWMASNFFKLCLSIKQAEVLGLVLNREDPTPSYVYGKVRVKNEADPLEDMLLCRNEWYHHMLKGISLSLTNGDKQVFWQLSGNLIISSSKLKLARFLQLALKEQYQSRFALAQAVAPVPVVPNDASIEVQRILRQEIRVYPNSDTRSYCFELNNVGYWLPQCQKVWALRGRLKQPGFILRINFSSQHPIFANLGNFRALEPAEASFSKSVGLEIFNFGDGKWHSIEASFDGTGCGRLWLLLKKAWNCMNAGKQDSLPVEEIDLPAMVLSGNSFCLAPEAKDISFETSIPDSSRLIPTFVSLGRLSESTAPLEAPVELGEPACFRPHLAVIKREIRMEDKQYYRIHMGVGCMLKFPSDLESIWKLNENSLLCEVRLAAWKRARGEIVLYARKSRSDEWTNLFLHYCNVSTKEESKEAGSKGEGAKGEGTKGKDARTKGISDATWDWIVRQHALPQHSEQIEKTEVGYSAKRHNKIFGKG